MSSNVDPVKAESELDSCTGSWNTMDVRPWNQPQMEQSGEMKFQPNLPIFVLGLNEFDMSNSHNLRIKAFADNYTWSSFKIHINTWADSILYSAGVNWFEVWQHDRDFQVGEFSTLEVRPYNQPQLKNSKDIKFDRPFASPPRVIIWITGFDFEKGKNYRLHATASNITSDGFTINLDSWFDSVLYSASASYIAYPGDNPRITSGTYSTGDVRAWNNPQISTSGKCLFGASKFAHIPRLTFGINFIDVACTGQSARFKASAKDLTKDGFTWNMDTWGDTTLYSLGASYIALDEGPPGPRKSAICGVPYCHGCANHFGKSTGHGH